MSKKAPRGRGKSDAAERKERGQQYNRKPHRRTHSNQGGKKNKGRRDQR